MITHTTAFVTPVVEHWLEREIAQWVHPMKDRSYQGTKRADVCMFLFVSAVKKEKKRKEKRYTNIA